MTTDRLDLHAALLDPPVLDALGGRPIDLADLDVIRLILRGNSVIDWHRAHFPDRAAVDRFFALHLVDMADPEDVRRVSYVHRQAVNYLHEHLGLGFPEDLAHPADVRDVFVAASWTGGFRRKQILACVILKLMHVIHHMEAAELRFQTPLSEADVLDLAERRIRLAAERMRESGFPLVAFYGSRKTRNSVITKLLAKKENTAVTIFDKLRFRIVTRDRAHVVPALAWLTRHLFPFNFVIPGQSHNSLLHLGELLSQPPFDALREGLQSLTDDDADLSPEDNPFSGGSYRMINFIVDFPVRVDHLVPMRHGALLGRTVLALVEFQVVDEATAEANEQGENAHDRYKERQRAIVERRLKRGRRRTGPGA